MYSHRVNFPKNLAKYSGNTSSKIFSCIRASADAGPACIRAKINSPRIFSCMYWFCAGTYRFLQKSAVSCENLRFPVVFCANLRLPNPLIYRARRKSAKICKNLRKCAFRVRFLPFAVSLLARPETVRQQPEGSKLDWTYFKQFLDTIL